MRPIQMYTQLFFLLLAFSFPLQAESTEPGLSAITLPSADITLSFLQDGRIETVHAKEGLPVETDQPLISQYDAIEQVQLARMEELSNDMTSVEAAEAKLAQTKTDLQKMEWAGQRGAVSELDIEHATLDVKIAELSLNLAKLEHQQTVRQYEEAKLRVDNMHLKSPIEGFVEEVLIEEGESVQALMGAIRVVRIDPLWVDVRVPLTMAYSVHPEDPVHIEFPPPQKAVLTGKVIFLGRAGDAASDTLKARIEVPNKEQRPSGERVLVKFTPSEKTRNKAKESAKPSDPKDKPDK